MEALQISCVRTRRVDGAEQITHLGGTLPDGKRWLRTVDAVIDAIENGSRFYVRSTSESVLVSVHRERSGKKTLGVGFDGDSGRLLALPRDRD